MIHILKRELELLSKETGFLQNQIEKALRMIGILNGMGVHPFLQDIFVLKGGTALNLFYLRLARLSMDIDLNYIGSIDRASALKDKQEIMTVIQDIFSADYEVSISREEYALTQFEFRYRTVSNATDKLRLEINHLLRLPMCGVHRLSSNELGQELTFPVLKLEEIVASKIVTLLSRYAARDLYDVYTAATLKLKLDSSSLRFLILYFALLSPINVSDLFQPKFEQITQTDMRRFLKPLLRRDESPEREEMVEVVKSFLGPLISVTELESETIKKFYSSGNLDLETIFSGTEIVEKISASPAFQCKFQNIKKENTVL